MLIEGYPSAEMFQILKRLFRTKVLHAIVLGQIIINIPILLFHFGGIPFIIELQLAWYWKLLLVLLQLGIGFVISLRYWQFMITRWRLKAFSMVKQDDWLLLKDWAKRSYLLHEDGSAWDDLERRTAGEHEVLSEIEELLQHFEIMELDKLNLEFPWRIEYRIKKGDAILELSLRLLFGVFGIYMCFQEQWFLGPLILLVILILGNKPAFYKYAFSRQAVLGLSENGFDLLLPHKIYIPWSEVVEIQFHFQNPEIEIHFYQSGKRSKVNIKLGTYAIPAPRDFLRLVQVYWYRYSNYADKLRQESASSN